jgi:hypothetical protein
MKIVIRTVIFHFICILLFAILYYYSSEQYQYQNISKNQSHSSLIDYIFLSTTIQAGVGLTDIYPISSYGKMLMIFQQFIMIMTHVFTIYVFTL